MFKVFSFLYVTQKLTPKKPVNNLNESFFYQSSETITANSYIHFKFTTTFKITINFCLFDFDDSDQRTQANDFT